MEPLDLQAATTALDSNLNPALTHAYTEYLEQYGRNDIQHWSSRLLVKRLTEDVSGDDEEEVAGEAQAQVQMHRQASYKAKTPESSQVHRRRRDDESDEEDLRSLIPQSKRIKLESGGNASLESMSSHDSRHTSSQAGRSSYRVPFDAAAAESNMKAKAEEVESVLAKIQG